MGTRTRCKLFITKCLVNVTKKKGTSKMFLITKIKYKLGLISLQGDIWKCRVKSFQIPFY